MGDLLAGLSFAGGLFGSRSAKKATKRLADAIERSAAMSRQTILDLSRPFTESASWALPYLRNVIQTQVAPRVGEDNAYLKAAHQLNLQDIERRRARSSALVDKYWSASGNVGRGRGEQLLVAQRAQDSVNRERLAYLGQQQDFRDRTLGTLLQSVGSMGQIGAAGLGAAVQGVNMGMQGEMAGAQARAQGSLDFWNDWGKLMGIPIGEWLADREQKRQKEL